MASQKIKHARVDFGLPAAEAQNVRSVSGKIKTAAQLRLEAKSLTSMPASHNLEDSLQFDAYSVIWNLNFRDKCYGWHTPNGGNRDAQEAVKFRGMGVKRGVPDLIFLMATARVIFIELKLGHYRREADQELFEHKARLFGFTDVYTCGTLREVAALLCHLFDMPPNELVFA